MKPFGPAVAALVVGIALGAWQPRGEVLELRAEADELRATASRPCRGRAADQIRTILRAEAPDAPEEPVEAEEPRPLEPIEEPLEPPPVDLSAGKQQMQAALDARRAQARAALVEQAELDDAEADEVDTIMDDMNRQIAREVARFVDDAVAAGDVDRRDVMDFAAESLDIVIAADDRLRETLGDEVYDEVDDEALDPLSYLSGETLDSLERLQDVPGLD